MQVLVVIIGFIAVLFSAAYRCPADTIYVDVNGPNDPGTGTYGDPFRRIQAAIDWADHYDVVIVSEGVYTDDPNNRNLSFDGKAITVRSIDPNDSNNVASTIIDPNGLGRAFYFSGQEQADSILKGFTITNGNASYGGGIYCCDNSSPTIANCVITDNSAEDYGGGIYCLNNSNPTIANCIISDNTAEIGAGICFVESDPVVSNCTITANQGNSGGGIASVAGRPTIVNCTISYNTAAEDGNGLACNSFQQQSPSDVQLTNCILWNGGSEIWNNDNSTITISYSDVYGGWEGEGNIDANPLLRPDGYHLESDSPCIDAANPFDDYTDQSDIDGERRLVGANADIGCDEFLRTGDLNYDGYVDTLDLSLLAGNWLQNGDGLTGDLNRSKAVDFCDFAVFAANWKPAATP